MSVINSSATVTTTTTATLTPPPSPKDGSGGRGGGASHAVATNGVANNHDNHVEVQTKHDFRLKQLLNDKEALLEPTLEWAEEITELFSSRLAQTPEFIIRLGDEMKLTLAEAKRCQETVTEVVHAAKAELTLVGRKTTDDAGVGHVVVVDEHLVRRKPECDDFQEVRIAVVGNVDSGKSTLLGVLTHCELDNGRGLARHRLFRHKHEQETGRTSSIGNDILGFDCSGQIVNKPTLHGHHLNWSKICEESSKVITFIDLAGHEKYLKTTIFGMTGHAPDYTMLMVGSNAGIIGMTKEHLGVTLALNIPVFVVVTKIDMCPPNILQTTLSSLKRMLKSAGVRKIPMLVANAEDVLMAATNFVSERLCPIFQVSNVTGVNLDLLRQFLNLLNTRMVNHDDDPAEYQIDEVYSVPGVGTVVSGVAQKGVIKVNDVLLMGPNSLGQYISAAIKSIHRKRLPVKEVRSGQSASFGLKKIKRNEVRKGMVLLCPNLSPSAYWEFEGEIRILHHPTTISKRYQAMVHCGNIRQTAQIIAMSQDCLRTGDRAMVHFRFIKNPEYLQVGMKILFREGRTKAVGSVTKLIVGTPPLSSSSHKFVHKN